MDQLSKKSHEGQPNPKEIPVERCSSAGEGYATSCGPISVAEGLLRVREHLFPCTCESSKGCYESTCTYTNYTASTSLS